MISQIKWRNLGILTLTVILMLTKGATAGWDDHIYGGLADDAVGTYTCLSTKWDLRVTDCIYNWEERVEARVGCCVHLDPTSHTPIGLSCPVNYNKCAVGQYVTSQLVDGSMTTVNPRWNVQSSIRVVPNTDQHDDKSGPGVLVIVGGVIGGLLLLVGLVICVCKCCSFDQREHDELSTLPMTPEQIRRMREAQRRRFYIRPFRSLYLIFIRRQSPQAPPPYQHLNEENVETKDHGPPPAYYDMGNNGSASAP